MTDTKFDVYVPLVGQDGNAFAIMGRVTDALARYLRKESELTATEIQRTLDEYRREATSGDYDHLLQTTMRWVRTVPNDLEDEWN
jgi:hypothetical protein